MLVSIVAVGTRGDVQPLMAIGLGLKAAGAKVRIITHPNFRPLAESIGLEYWPLLLDIEKVFHTNEGMEWLTAGRNVLKTVTQMTKLWELHFHSMFHEIHRGCEGSNVILFSYLGMGACHIGEKYDIKCIGTWPTPVTIVPNSAMAMTIPGSWAPMLDGKLALAAHYAGEQMVWQTFGKAQNKWRERLGLRPLRFPGIMHHFRKRKIPFLYGFSPQIIGQPAEWPLWVRISGYWLLESKMSWEPPPDLVDFIQQGEQPFYVGFGSMVTHEPYNLVRTVIDALERANVRGVISTGWTGLQADTLKTHIPSTVFPVDYVSHSWLFPRMRGVVHHGGASTTGAALHAGRPSTVVPFFADQAFWGDTLELRGVATRSIPFHKLNAKVLASALTEMKEDQELHDNALSIAGKLAQEDGVKNAVDSIFEFVGRKPHHK